MEVLKSQLEEVPVNTTGMETDKNELQIKLQLFWNRTVCCVNKGVVFDVAGEGKDDAGYMHVSVCELKHPPPQLCPMPEGLSSQQVCVCVCVDVSVCARCTHLCIKMTRKSQKTSLCSSK